MAFGWGDGGVTLRLNGVWIIASKGEHDIPETAEIKGLVAPPLRDFTSENETQAARRHAQLQTFCASNRRKIRGDDADALEALRTSAIQLKDAMAHIKGGELHYIEQVASILRKAVAIGDPLPLLQLGAAMREKPLIVYDSMEPPIKGVADITLSIKGACWAQPNELNQNAIDLDLWLDSAWGTVGREHISHRDAITKIGHTIGAHFSLDKWPLEKVLRSASSELGGVREDYLIRYLVQVAEVTLALADLTLADR